MQSWAPEPLFRGRTVFVLGNGPSLECVDLTQLDPATTIAVNAAGEVMPDAAVLFARDASWCLKNTAMIDAWPGIKVTTSLSAARQTGMRYVPMERRDDFPPPGAPAIRYGVSSGHVAVSLAIAMAAQTVVLIGFDCRQVNGRTHWHDHYSEGRLDAYGLYQRGWTGWWQRAMDVGCCLLNATPGSAITEFPFTDVLDEVA